MHARYPFLENESAITEIRKHKWLESEKLGRDIGFVTAALDWIRNYGQGWLEYTIRTEKS